jgi:hypothetical protein
MASFIALLVTFLVVGLLASAGVMAIFAIFLRKLQTSIQIQRILFIIVGSLIATPSLVPAGTLAVLPLPLGVALAFTRSVCDLLFLVKTWWFFLPSAIFTAASCWYIAQRVFPNDSFKADGSAAA